MNNTRKTKAQLIRELEIEGALNRVRAQALAMQKSEQIGGVTGVLFDAFQSLGYDLFFAAIAFEDSEAETVAFWAEGAWLREALDRPEERPPARAHVEDEFWDVHEAARARGESHYVFQQDRETNLAGIRKTLEMTGYSQAEIERLIESIPPFERMTAHRVFFSRGHLAFLREEPFSDADLAVAKRFADVFDFAYRRFLELKEKEDQNRELTIQNALERVRARALGMQGSAELALVANALFSEFQELGLPVFRSSIHTIEESTNTALSWQSLGNAGEIREPLRFPVNMFNHSDIERASHEAKLRGEPHFVQRVEGDELRDYYKAAWEISGRPPDSLEAALSRMPDPQFLHRIFASQVSLSVTTYEPLSEEQLAIVRRFADVFDFAYTRFLELKTAEEQAREAERRAAVDRVRAEATGMAKTEDIADVLKTLWEGLKSQDVPFNYVTLYVADEAADLLQVYAAMPESNPITDLISDDVRARVRARRTFREDMIDDVDLLRSEIALSEALELGFSTEYFSSSQVVRAPRSAPLVYRLWGITLPEGGVEQYALRVGFGHGDIVLNAPPDVEFPDETVRFVEQLAGAVGLGFARFFDFHRLEEQNRALQEANAQIQEATRLKSQFLATMSHELRTPMNAIIGFTRLVLRRGAEFLPERQRENLEKVKLSADHLLSLINDILDLSKVEAGRIDISASAFDVAPVIENCCATVGPTLGKDGVDLFVDISPEVGQAHTDEARFRQVIINLVSNALKFTDSGEVKVEARIQETGDRRQEGDGVEAGGMLEIVVSDTGIGIAREHLETIFEEFRQVDGSGTRRHQGTGLGLAITKKLIELLGGTIDVESELGKGSRFTVSLPSAYGELR